MSSFPDDFDGDTLRLIQAQGVNLDDVRELEFVIDAPDLQIAEWACTRLKGEGFTCEVEYFPDGTMAELVATCRLKPTYENVVRIQRDIADLLEDEKLFVAGWGTAIEPPQEN